MNEYEFVIEGEHYAGTLDPWADADGWEFFDTTDLLDLGDGTRLLVYADNDEAAISEARATLGDLASGKYRVFDAALWWQNPPGNVIRRVYRWEC